MTREERREAAVRWVVEHSIETGRPLGHPEAAMRRGRDLLELMEGYYRIAKMLLPEGAEVRGLAHVVDELHAHCDRMGEEMLLRARPVEQPQHPWQEPRGQLAWPGGAGQAG